MLFRFAKLWIVAGLLAILWALGSIPREGSDSFVRTVGAKPGPVRILQFYASVGSLTKGDKALLCYGVENAKAVRISPMLQGVYPSPKRCVEIVPEHTTHYTLLAEGYDGKVAAQSVTLAVMSAPEPSAEPADYAEGLQPVSTAESFERPACGPVFDDWATPTPSCHCADSMRS
jgi:hypothetical protein